MRKLFHAIALCFPIVVLAQQIDVSKQFKNWKPRNIGPASMSGRITTVDAVISNPNHIWIGAASGGVWKTANAGVNWEPVFDEQPILNIGSIAIQQNNPNIVWVGTGEGNPRNSINIGEGIYKTLDAGKTWKRMGLEKTRNIHRLILDPNNPNTIYAGAIGNPYAQHPERGLFKTTDGGETWNKILYTNDTSGVADMIMDPTNSNKLFVAMWHHYRTPYSLQSGGNGSGFYMTIDGGKNFIKLGKEHGLPEGNYGRIGVAICRNKPSRVYALIEAKKNGLYKSDDGGYKWELVNSDASVVTNRPFYFQDITCDPINENRLWMTNQTVTMSEDAGKTWKTIIPYSGIHPDHHAFWIHPTDPNFIIDGNDGGIGITRDGGKNWMLDEKIPVGQFYHINVDNAMPYKVMGGMQDNGSWRGPAYVWESGGIRNYMWENLWGGDGFDVMPDPENEDWVYAMSQGGNVGKYNAKTGQSWQIKPPAPNTATTLRFNWNAAIAQDPFDNSTIYFGSQHVHKSINKGASWEVISGDLSTNDSAKIDQSKNGGLSIDITGAENYCTIICIEPSKLQKNVLWAGTDDGNVQLTQDGGKTWTNFRGKIPGLPLGAWIAQIKAGRHNIGEAFVVANDYRRGDFKPYIFRTTDFGKTWTRLVDEKKVVGYALCTIQDPTEPNLIFVGTEQGLWISLDNGANFQQFKNGYPSVSTYDLAIQEREADLAIATFGRSLWILDDIRALRKLAANKGILEKNFTAFTAPTAVQATYRNSPYEWSTWGLWDADNRRRGAAINYFIKKLNTNQADKKDTVNGKTQTNKVDSILVAIYNDKNEIIRNLKWKADTGFQKNIWGMEEKGFRQPGVGRTGGGRFGGGANNAEPAGWQALPGNYKVVLSYGNDKDSTMVTIIDDPRIENNNEVKLAQRTLLTKFRKSVDKLVAATDRISDAEEILTKATAQLKDAIGKDADSARKETKKWQDEVKKVKEFISGKIIERQGYGQIPEVTVMSRMRQATQSITAKPIIPGAQEERLVAEAEESISNAVNKVNTLFGNKWMEYRKLVESIPPSKIFKDFKPIE
jgi:photosystem II stability/assembly factor-like uncharacterized protein